MRWLIKSAMCDLLPATDTLPGLASTDLDGFLDKLAAESPLLVRLGLFAGVMVFVLMPVVTVYVPLPSVMLPAAKRRLHAERAASTSLYLPRQAVFLLKMYACMCWGQDPAIRGLLHLKPYPPDPGTFTP